MPMGGRKDLVGSDIGMSDYPLLNPKTPVQCWPAQEGCVAQWPEQEGCVVIDQNKKAASSSDQCEEGLGQLSKGWQEAQVR